MTKRIIYCFTLLIVSLNLNAAQPDWSLYNELLQRYIIKKTVNDIPLNYVKYQALFDDANFEKVIATIENFPTDGCCMGSE